MSEPEQLRQKTEPPEGVSPESQPEMVPLWQLKQAQKRIQAAKRTTRRLQAAADFWHVRIESYEDFEKGGRT